MQERRKDLAEKLENGLKELYASDKYAEYLKTMSRFPRYSSRNTLLIYMQKPGASRVAGATRWKSEFKRYPKKGEKALYIYAPIKNDKDEKRLMEKIDPQTGAPMLDKDGKIIMEEMTLWIRCKCGSSRCRYLTFHRRTGSPSPKSSAP